MESCRQKSVFGTKEWGKRNVNLIAGCSHDCLYCYAKSTALRYGTTTIDAWKNEVPNKRKMPKRYQKRDGTTMFPSTHDITPEHLDYCIDFLSRYLLGGNDVLIVTKPHFDCIKAMCDSFRQYHKQILFRFTIGSSDSDILKFWEPGAPGFDERVAALSYAKAQGFKTSVSCEPMLDDNVRHLIDAVMPYVTDAIWLGLPNDLMKRCRQNGHGDQETMKKARGLMDLFPDEYVFELYSRYKDNTQIKWKESIKRIVGIDIPTESGLDI